MEIGGSFRIPEIMVQCGCILREVGATNKTHLQDFRQAISPQTRAFLKVHTSNYRIVGFSESVPLDQLVVLGHSLGLPVIEDLGSGSLMDLEALGIRDEPTVLQSVQAGADVISFSGDKLLGGPQAGIIVGKREWVEPLKKHPLARALRVDKMTLAALQETLLCCEDPALARQEIPVLAMLAAPPAALQEKAALLCHMLSLRGISARMVETEGQVGGGSAPTQVLPSWAVVLESPSMTPEALEAAMRVRPIPVIGRITRERYQLDVRTMLEEDLETVVDAAAEVLG